MSLYFSTTQHTWFNREKTTILPAIDDNENEYKLILFQWPRWAINVANAMILDGYSIEKARQTVSEILKEKRNAISNF